MVRVIKTMTKFLITDYNGWGVIVTALIASFTWVYGGTGFVLGVILIFTVADFVTGIIKAAMNGEVESAKVMRTVYKIVGYCILLAVLHILFVRYMPTIPSLAHADQQFFPDAMLVSGSVIPHIVGAMIAIREVMSIIENLSAAGILPKSVVAFLSRIFKRTDDGITS